MTDVTQEWTLKADEVLALPLDELALLVLSDAHATDEWNWRNWLLKAAQHAYPNRPEVLQALGEAWGWLQNRGLISWNQGQDSAMAFVISRKGHEVLREGLPWLRAVERLDVQLVPELEYTARPHFLRGDFRGPSRSSFPECPH